MRRHFLSSRRNGICWPRRRLGYGFSATRFAVTGWPVLPGLPGGTATQQAHWPWQGVSTGTYRAVDRPFWVGVKMVISAESSDAVPVLSG